MLFDETFHENNQPYNPFLHVRAAGELHADKKYVIKRESSKTSVIGYIISGTLHVDIYSKTYQVYTGNCFILPYEKQYKMYSDVHFPCRMLWINIRGKLFESLVDTLFQPNTMIIATYNMEQVFNKLIGLLPSSYDRSTSVMKLLSSLLIDLQNHIHLPKDFERKTTLNSLSTMDNYITNRVQFGFNVVDMAKYFHLSVSQLNRVFKKEFGVTPYRYYQKVRIDLAKSMLSDSDFSIDDISERLGFSNRNNFTACFKMFADISPARYKKQLDMQKSTSYH